ncbi:MAG TPA: CU044_5270 family protein [Streptosporangiaceae bacterium]
MNDPTYELTMVSELRAEVPEPDNARLATGRALLISKATKPERTRAIHIARPAFLVPALAVTAAAAVAITYALSPGSANPPTKQVAQGRSTTPASVNQAQLAARVLNTASNVVSRAPVPAEPGPGQWIYEKTVNYQNPGGTSTDQEWITFDGGKSAYYANGNSGPILVHANSGMARTAGLSALAAFNANATPKTAYDAVASLPLDPRALLDAVAEAAGKIGAENLAAGTPLGGSVPTTKGQLEFDYLSSLLWNAAGGVGAPATAEAAAYRAMATIPGVSVQQGITDAAGDPAISVSDNGGYSQILLDPVSYQVIGLRQVSDGVGPVVLKGRNLSPAVVARIKARMAQLRKTSTTAYANYLHQLVAQHLAVGSFPPPGTVTLSLAYAKVSEVSGPGAN